VPLVRRLIAAYPDVPARLLIGNETISDNPKLNNVCKGWRAAAHDWIVMADSNVLMPRDYIERLLAAWRAASGRCSPPHMSSQLWGCRWPASSPSPSSGMALKPCSHSPPDGR
jgi:hypothetical protein